MTKWTKEQQLAIDARDSNLLVAAAAGSGKTAVLVQRIINKVLDTKNMIDIDKLLVVTFTNAAALEMKERIGDALSSALEKNPTSKHLQRQLTILNKASITTIHSFCLEVIRNNFHKIDLDPSFRVADTTETVLLKQEVLEDVFEDYYLKEDNEDFLSLVECYCSNKDDLFLQNLVLKIYEFSKALPWPYEWLEKSYEEFNINNEEFDFSKTKWAKSLLSNYKIEFSGFTSLLKSAIEIINEYDELEKYKGLFNDEYNKITNIVNHFNDWNDFCKEIANIEFKNLPSVKNVSDEETKKMVTDIRKNVKEAINDIKSSLNYHTNENIKSELNFLYPIMKVLGNLVIDFDKEYAIRKKEKSIVDFHDIEHFALDILVEKNGQEINPSNAALFYREKFEEILIDEYQDSNLVQEVLLSIISRENKNRFMVGDVKQSIYRFRQAKPELFLQKYNTYSDSTDSSERRIMLYKNFRSRKEVVHAVNYIFERIMSVNVGELEYTDLEKLNLGASYEEDEENLIKGPVDVCIIQKTIKLEENSSNEEENEKIDKNEDEEIDNITLEARVVASKIKQIINSKSKIFDKTINTYRPVQYKDIVVLLRATSNWANIFVDEFAKEDILCFADVSCGYFENIEVKTIISLLEVIDNPMKDIPLIAVLRSPIFSFNEQELVDIRLEDEKLTFYESMIKICSMQNDLSRKIRRFLDILSIWQQKSNHMSIDEFLWYLYMESGYYGYVGSMKLGVQRQANLRILFERARGYEQTSFKGLFNFINFINKLKKSSEDLGSAKIIGENENVVRIMSIHKSKGLEFPVVVCCAMGKQFNTIDLKNSVLYHQDLGFGPEFVDYKKRFKYPTIFKKSIQNKIKIENLSEEMRILYVALTRAKEKLILTGSINDVEKYLQKIGIERGEDKKLLEYNVLKAKCYFDFVIPSLLKHEDAKELRKIASYNHIEYDNESSWNIELFKKEDFIKDKIKEEENVMNIADRLKEIDKEKNYSKNFKEINDRLSFKYMHYISTTLPAKISVSEIKRILNDEEDRALNMFRYEKLRKPNFLEKEDTLSSAEKGTILHLVLQKLDFYNDNIKEQINNLVKNEILTLEQSKSVSLNKIYKFLNSKIGQRIKNSSRIKREVPFHIQINSKEVYSHIPKDYEDEYIAVQGIIDLYIEENEDLVLIDYKSDYVNDENKEEVIKKYIHQMKLYEKALSMLTGKKVKEKYIYLFGIDEAISIE